jgi:hypothetical protein
MNKLDTVNCKFCGKTWSETHHDCHITKCRFLNPAFEIIYPEDDPKEVKVLDLDYYRIKKFKGGQK